MTTPPNPLEVCPKCGADNIGSCGSNDRVYECGSYACADLRGGLDDPYFARECLERQIAALTAKVAEAEARTHAIWNELFKTPQPAPSADEAARIPRMIRDAVDVLNNAKNEVSERDDEIARLRVRIQELEAALVQRESVCSYCGPECHCD